MVTQTSRTATVGTQKGTFLRRQLWIWPLVAAAVLAFVAIWVRSAMEEAIGRGIAASLETIRDANAEALREWSSATKAQVELLAEDEQVRALVENLLKTAMRTNGSAVPLTASPAYAALRAHLKPAEEGRGFSGYAVLDTNLVVVAAGMNQLVGAKSPPEYAAQLAPCFAGNTTLTPPFLAPGPSPEPGGTFRATVPLMYAAAPVHSSAGQVIAVLALRIDPEKDFTRILATARSGASGETYAFSRNGMLLSESRFDEELKLWGLIPDTEEGHSLLNLELRDPLVDLSENGHAARRRSELPFLKPVSEALAGRDGLDARGYRDYRGVEVVGAWRWLPEFDLGLVTQIDLEEAMAPVRVVRLGFWFLFGLLTAGAVVVFVLMRMAERFHDKARQAALAAKQLGQYALDDPIGTGAFGTVYRGHHALMRRPVAVKVLAPTADERSIARFEREVQLTCQLTHPNTIALYDYGRTEEGMFYYAMEYLDGLSLDRLIRDHGPQPEGRVIHILRQICGSLAEAHAQGLVHRDIKPQNIFLTRRGGIPDFVKVLDFGLVKARNLAGQLELTAANATMGTPLYMSPEAVQHPETVDALSDIYSLGCVGYELLTGQTVFGGLSLGEVLMQQLRARPEPPSTRLKRPVSRDLEELVLQCLEKKPSSRPTGAAALEEALRRCARSGDWTRQAAERWWTEQHSSCPESDHAAGAAIQPPTNAPAGQVPAAAPAPGQRSS